MKPIARVRMTTHTEDDLKTCFLEYQNTLTKYRIQRAKYINNMHKPGVRIGCSTGEIVIVPTHISELYSGSPKNGQSLTIIETICADASTPLLLVLSPWEEI